MLLRQAHSLHHSQKGWRWSGGIYYCGHHQIYIWRAYPANLAGKCTCPAEIWVPMSYRQYGNQSLDGRYIGLPTTETLHNRWFHSIFRCWDWARKLHFRHVRLQKVRHRNQVQWHIRVLCLVSLFSARRQWLKSEVWWGRQSGRCNTP